MSLYITFRESHNCGECIGQTSRNQVTQHPLCLVWIKVRSRALNSYTTFLETPSLWTYHSRIHSSHESIIAGPFRGNNFLLTHKLVTEFRTRSPRRETQVMSYAILDSNRQQTVMGWY